MALQEVVVTSHHTHTHKDKHLGIAYDFEPNKQKLIPLAAAVHFFGVGLPAAAPARQAAWKRHGFTENEKGEAYLRKFECKVVDLVPQGSDVSELKEKHEKTLEEIETAHDNALGALEEEHRAEVQRLMTRIVELEGPKAKTQK